MLLTLGTLYAVAAVACLLLAFAVSFAAAKSADPQSSLAAASTAAAAAAHQQRVVAAADAGRNPVVLVPGLIGSSLESAPLSSTDAEWDRLWFSVTRAVNMDKFFDDMSLVYDAATDTYANITGLAIRTIDGTDYNTGGVDFLDKVLGVGVVGTDYFNNMIKYLEKKGGYTRDVDIKALPFDWRMPGIHPQMAPFYEQAQAVIEQLSEANGGNKVVIVAHSYGNHLTSKLLAMLPQDWKDKYVKAYVAIAAPLAGSVETVEACLSGQDMGMELFGWTPLPLHKLRAVQRNYGSMGAMAPTHLWGDFTLVSTPWKNYTYKGILELYDEVGATNSSAIYKHTRMFEDYDAPGVWVPCLYGTEVKTRGTLVYPNGNWDDKPDYVFVDGDGTVPTLSSTYCERCAKPNFQPASSWL
eukprot:TRINITY_DN3443_c0_g2_i2.p2 TRINITY_DN3443_c0_g2~~TRINITY_DN3443_c0_g2_i2.p2  ORF type:complete len:412 (+),score=123.58 TRINITY_DN3443_c0_g2_i2:59-1294(+)